MEGSNLLALLLQEVPVYVPPQLIGKVTEQIQTQFSAALGEDPYFSDIFKLTDQIPFPTYDINLQRTPNIFPDFLREVVKKEQTNNYQPDILAFTLDGAPHIVPLKYWKVFSYLSLFYKTIIASVYKQINIIKPYRFGPEKTPERIKPEDRIEYLLERLVVGEFAVTFDWRKTIATLFTTYVLDYPLLKDTAKNQGLLILSKVFPLYVTLETSPSSFPPKFNYLTPDIWLKVQERSNADYGNNRFTLFNLLPHPISSLAEAEVELGMFPLSSSPPASPASSMEEAGGGRKFSSDEYARQAHLLLPPCDRYSYDDLMRMTRIALVRQPDAVLMRHRVPISPGTYNRSGVIARMNTDISYYNKYLLCSLLSEFSSFPDAGKEENKEIANAINTLFPLQTTNLNQLYYSLVTSKISSNTRREIYLDNRKAAPVIATIISKTKLPPPTTGITTNPNEVIPLRKVRMILGLKGAFEVLCYALYNKTPLLTRLKLGEGDFIVVTPAKNEIEMNEQKMSIYPLTKDPEALFVV